MKKGVMRPGHIQLRVLDMAQALEHYVELLGLIEVDRDERGRVYLKGWTEVDKFSVVLRAPRRPSLRMRSLVDRIGRPRRVKSQVPSPILDRRRLPPISPIQA